MPAAAFDKPFSSFKVGAIKLGPCQLPHYSETEIVTVKSKLVLLLPVIMHGSMVDTFNHLVCPIPKYTKVEQEERKMYQ